MRSEWKKKSEKSAGRKRIESRERWVKIGKALREIRESLGLSQEDMADILGVSWTTYQRYEKGKINPENILPLIEETLGIPEIEIRIRAGLYDIDDIIKAIKRVRGSIQKTTEEEEMHLPELEEIEELLRSLPPEKRRKAIQTCKEQLELMAV